MLFYTCHLCDDRMAEKTAKVMGYTENRKRELGITNLTVLDIPTSYGNYSINNIIFVPPAVSYSRNVIGISTVNGRMTITCHNIKKL